MGKAGGLTCRCHGNGGQQLAAVGDDRGVGKLSRIGGADHDELPAHQFGKEWRGFEQDFKRGVRLIRLQE